MWRVKSYRILDPKFKTFSRLYSKTKISFFRLKVIKYVINRDLKKLWCATSIRARLNKIWTKRKKLTYKVLVVALKKKLKTFYHFFQTLSLFSRLFPGLESCWANFKTFSRIQESMRTLNLGREKIDQGKRELLTPPHNNISPHTVVPRPLCIFPGYSQVSRPSEIRMATSRNQRSTARKPHGNISHSEWVRSIFYYK